MTDDGVGVATADLARRLGEGHIGLASHALRVEAAGGSIEVIEVVPASEKAAAKKNSVKKRAKAEA